jgi:hypothetical protein
MTEGQTPGDLHSVCRKSLTNQLIEMIGTIDFGAEITVENLSALAIGQSQFQKRRAKKKVPGKSKQRASARFNAMDPFGVLMEIGTDDDTDMSMYGQQGQGDSEDADVFSDFGSESRHDGRTGDLDSFGGSTRTGEAGNGDGGDGSRHVRRTKKKRTSPGEPGSSRSVDPFAVQYRDPYA